MPMLTWSSWPARRRDRVHRGRVRQRLATRETSDAAVYCTSMNPEFSPLPCDQERGEVVVPLRIEQPVEAALADRSPAPPWRCASVSSATATGWPWKFPPERTSSSSGSTIGLSETDARLDLQHALDVVERVAGRAVHLRRAPQRVRVLHQVRALAVRRQDRRAGEQPAEVRRRCDLPGVRPEPLQPFVERGVGAERRLDRHRRGDVGRPREVGDAARGQDPDREHALGPVDERQPLLRLQRDRRQARHARAPRRPARCRPRRGARPGRSAAARGWRAAPGRRTRRANPARAPTGSASRFSISTMRSTISGRTPGVPERQDVRAEQQHRSRLLAGAAVARRPSRASARCRAGARRPATGRSARRPASRTRW